MSITDFYTLTLQEPPYLTSTKIFSPSSASKRMTNWTTIKSNNLTSKISGCSFANYTLTSICHHQKMLALIGLNLHGSYQPMS